MSLQIGYVIYPSSEVRSGRALFFKVSILKVYIGLLLMLCVINVQWIQVQRNALPGRGRS